MGLSLLVRIIITSVALGLAIIRIIRPTLGIDWTTFAIVAVALFVLFGRGIRLKAVDLFGLKLEFEKEDSKTTSSEEPAVLPSVQPPTPTLAVPDSYTDTIIKLTPIETIAPYIIVVSIIKASHVPYSTIVLLSAFAVFLTITIIYYGRFLSSTTQVVSLSLTFVGWAYAFGEPFSSFGLYNPVWAALVLAFAAFALPAAYQGIHRRQPTQ